MTTLVVFEDEGWRAFEILVALRGVFDLRCGGQTLLERLLARSQATRLVLVARPALRSWLATSHPTAQWGAQSLGGVKGEVVFANGRLLALGQDLATCTASGAGSVAYFAGATLVAGRCTAAEAMRLLQALESRLEAEAVPLDEWLQRELPSVSLRRDLRLPNGSKLLEHAWDLVRENGAAIIDDFRSSSGPGVDAAALVYPGVHLIQDSAIRIGPGCRIKPGAVFDAEDGPITLEADVIVQPNVVVRGPTHVGPRCLLRAGAKVHEGTSLGPACKIGGEIEETVVQGFSNKQHEGFLGHAYLGEWVNLGADTNNSDLKNNYSSVRVWERGHGVDSGSLFVGLLCGDHVKSAIDTSFNTGTVVGTASQIFGAGFPPKFVAPFSWGGAGGFELHDFDRALGTARAVMQRRGIELLPDYAAALRSCFETWRDRPRSQGLS